MSNRKAKVPFNKDGRIAPYRKSGPKRPDQKDPVLPTPLKDGIPKSRSQAPTVDQIQADRLTGLANKYWAPHTLKNHQDFDPEVSCSK